MHMYCVTIFEKDITTRIVFGCEDNAERINNFAITHGYGVHVKKVPSHWTVPNVTKEEISRVHWFISKVVKQQIYRRVV